MIIGQLGEISFNFFGLNSLEFCAIKNEQVKNKKK